MNEETIYKVNAAARNFLRFFHERPQWQQQMIRWCLGYKACHYLEVLDRAIEDSHDRP